MIPNKSEIDFINQQIELLQEALKALEDRKNILLNKIGRIPFYVYFNKVREIIAEELQIDISDITGNSREKKIMWGKHLLRFFIFEKEGNMCTTRDPSFFNRHSINNSIEKVSSYATTDKNLLLSYTAINNKIQEYVNQYTRSL